MTSFAITDTISGSIISYGIVYGSNIQNKTACMEGNCEYTVDLPFSICSTSNDVNVAVAAANLLGFGQPTEPITIGMFFTTIIMHHYDHNNYNIRLTTTVYIALLIL